MAEPRIKIENVTKTFTLRQRQALKDLLIAAVKRRDTGINTFKALNNVSFDVQEGETVGLVGYNGSGKSTLLKLVSGVMHPDAGKVMNRGKVAGLIEVGAGFHPDLTGRQNVFLNAAILGMSKEETEDRFDDIVKFSEIEQFIDREVKFYSSGMFLRLAFAVSVYTNPDVFLVDEILAVGDEPFQKKCLARIHEMQEDGRTLVIVSHDLDMLEKLCTRGIVLQKGTKIYDGTITKAVETLRAS